ncbi:short-chain dehydrogenase/reductase, partial [Microthyrium microscopicum]
MDISRLTVDIGLDMLFGSANSFSPDKDIPSLDGKVIVVTGGNNGIGKETILRLAKHNPASIYLCSRDLARGEAAAGDMRSAVPTAQVKILQLDLASLKSVAAAAASFNGQADRLDILINNAGIMGVPAGKTAEGYEIQLGTNHLGHALLTKLLLPTMLKTSEEKGGDVRILNLSSGAHLRAAAPGFDPKDMDMENASPLARYSRSKLANVLFAKQLATRYPQITSVSLHPGVIKTDLFTPVMMSNRALGMLSSTFGFLVYKTVEEGAKNSLWAATVPKDKLVNGGYYNPVGQKNDGSAFARDQKMAESLWQWTED